MEIGESNLLRFFREIIDSRQGSTNPDAFAGIGRADAHLGILDSADEWYERALQGYRQADDRGKQAEIMMCLAELAEDTGRLEDAIVNFDEARSILVQVDDSFNSARAEASLGRVKAKMAMPYEAANHYQRAFNIFASSAAPYSEADVLASLTDVMINLGELAAAVEYAARGAQITRALGSGEAETSFLKKLAQLHRAQGNPVQALSACEQALWASARTLGMNHADTLTIASDIASLWHEGGNLSAALLMDEFTLDRRRLVLGDNHPDTLYSARRLAADMREIGDLQEARSLDEDTLARYRVVLGNSHRDTQALADDLAVESGKADYSPADDRRSNDDVTVSRYNRLAPEYLCYLRDANGARAGMCFRVAPGVLVAAWAELRQIGAVIPGSTVRVSPVSIDSWFGARVVRVDQDRDLAVLVTGVNNTSISSRSPQGSLSWLSRFTVSSLMTQGEAVRVIGSGQPDMYSRGNATIAISGEWAGQTSRDRIPVGVIFVPFSRPWRERHAGNQGP